MEAPDDLMFLLDLILLLIKTNPSLYYHPTLYIILQ